ncbi:putative gcn5-related n-acetyltransferase [Diaporthe ampelina]|uniref:Putative gcn5-related n-acetyltransferase n=1 Tax=Diaporthe ampelina TaxID=1214573 RepID=A0A0G2FSK2_9PEZI|nr:putative gcn5-related n-acetyltransferase [Diaporthe ampelina]
MHVPSESGAPAATGRTIASPRLTIRTAVPSDGEALVAYFSNPANFPWPAEKDLTLEKILPRIDRWADATAKGRSAFMVIVLRETDQLIGFGGFNNLPRTEPLGDNPAWKIRKGNGEGTVLVADVGVSIDHQHQRRGYAREAVCAVVEYGFEELGCAYAHLDTQSSNEPMKALMSGLGIQGVEGDGSEPLEDSAFSFASKAVNYDVDRATWNSLREELKNKGTWPL